tara:strand:- start:348 stop:461 length:114 start_codon:yes stop_codon:yes gene_type:complete
MNESSILLDIIPTRTLLTMIKTKIAINEEINLTCIEE